MSKREKKLTLALIQGVGGAFVAIIITAAMSIKGLELFLTFSYIWLLAFWAIDDVLLMVAKGIEFWMERRNRHEHLPHRNIFGVKLRRIYGSKRRNAA